MHLSITFVLFSVFIYSANCSSYGSAAAKPCVSAVTAPYGGSKPCSSSSGIANPYNYAYTAKVGVKEDGMIAAQEQGDGKGTVSGSYALMDPDGRMRMVYYKADAMGFRATVKTNEPGTANENPADIVMQSSYSTPASSSGAGK